MLKVSDIPSVLPWVGVWVGVWAFVYGGGVGDGEVFRLAFLHPLENY